MQYEAIVKKYIGLTNVHCIRSVIIVLVLFKFLYIQVHFKSDNFRRYTCILDIFNIIKLYYHLN